MEWKKWKKSNFWRNLGNENSIYKENPNWKFKKEWVIYSKNLVRSRKTIFSMNKENTIHPTNININIYAVREKNKFIISLGDK